MIIQSILLSGIFILVIVYVLIFFNFDYEDLKMQTQKSRKAYKDRQDFWDSKDRLFNTEVNFSKLNARQAAGKEYMASHSVVFMGLCRDIAPVLRQTLDDVSVMGSLFKDYRYIVYENDSKDDTPNILNRWKKQDEIHNILISETDVKINGGRLVKMQHLRQKCMDYYINNVKPSFNADLVIVMDMDLIIGVHLDSFVSAFAWDQDWDIQWGSGFNYYHVEGPYAWFFTGVLPKTNYDSLASIEPDGTHIKTQRIWDRTSHNKPALVPMLSAFNGIAIYKSEAFEAGHYISDSKEEVCEHVVFHKNVLKAGFTKVYINTTLLIVR